MDSTRTLTPAITEPMIVVLDIPYVADFFGSSEGLGSPAGSEEVDVLVGDLEL